MARYLFSGLLIITLQIGCAHHRGDARPLVSSALPAEEAPRFELSIDGNPAVSTVSHRIEPDIRIVDARDELEKQYYPGENDPHRWRDAVTVIPMEAFQPGLEKQLRRTVIDSLLDPLKYASIEIKVTSFFATLDKRNDAEEQLLFHFKQWDDDQDERDIRQEELERKQEIAEQEARVLRKSLGIPPVNGNTDDTFGSRVGEMLWRSAVVKPMRERSRNRERDEQLKALPQTLPTEFTTDSLNGWNCFVKVEVMLHNEDGKSQVVKVQADYHLVDDQASPPEGQCQSVVLSTLDKLRQQLKEKQI